MARVIDGRDLEHWWRIMMQDDYGCQGFGRYDLSAKEFKRHGRRMLLATSV